MDARPATVRILGWPRIRRSKRARVADAPGRLCHRSSRSIQRQHAAARPRKTPALRPKLVSRSGRRVRLALAGSPALGNRRRGLGGGFPDDSEPRPGCFVADQQNRRPVLCRVPTRGLFATPSCNGACARRRPVATGEYLGRDRRFDLGFERCVLRPGVLHRSGSAASLLDRALASQPARFQGRL